MSPEYNGSNGLTPSITQARLGANRLQLIRLLLRASLGGVKEDVRTSDFKLKTVEATLVQADGEIITLDPQSSVLISIDKRVLRCYV